MYKGSLIAGIVLLLLLVVYIAAYLTIRERIPSYNPKPGSGIEGCWAYQFGEWGIELGEVQVMNYPPTKVAAWPDKHLAYLFWPATWVEDQLRDPPVFTR